MSEPGHCHDIDFDRFPPVSIVNTRDWRVHPGEMLRELLDERRIWQTELAQMTGWTQKHVNHVINGRSSITAQFAVTLEMALGPPSAEFWMRLQVGYDLHAAREDKERSS